MVQVLQVGVLVGSGVLGGGAHLVLVYLATIVGVGDPVDWPTPLCHFVRALPFRCEACVKVRSLVGE